MIALSPFTLIHDDSLLVLPSLDDRDHLEEGVRVHVITDPPYEDHMHAAKAGARGPSAHERGGKTSRRIRTDGHANPPPVDFASVTDIRFDAAKLMAAASTGWLLAFCTPEGVAPWRDAIEAAGAKYKRACVWVKPDSAPQFNGQGPAMGAEMFVAAWCGPGFASWNGGGRRGVFTHNCQPSDRTGEHPTEKPIALMMELVALFTNPGDVVVDPFMGSGSTGVAAVRLGRRFIGIEKDAKYFALAQRRIIEAQKQGDMFVAPAAPAKQIGMEL
jgi:site-specific DNA-methyltransferase (adenine-specific)